MADWAWAEYFKGRAGEHLVALVEGPAVATCVLTLGELAELHERGGEPGLEDHVAFIGSRGRILTVTEEAAVRAGRTKWAQRHAGHDMGIVDAMIYETARANGLEVVTGDEGFKGLEGVRMIAVKGR